MTTNEELLHEMQTMYNKLNEAYELAGSLRDSFTSVHHPILSGELKAYCNRIRSDVYQLNEYRGRFAQSIKSIQQ